MGTLHEDDLSAPEPLLRVMSLHALEYCERLFYLEEVEEIRIADASVYAGRTLHQELAAEEGEERCSYLLSSERLGITGKMDALRHREGAWIPYEHKRGRPRRDARGAPEAWESDRLQVCAYGMLMEEHLGNQVPEGRIRYHAEGVTVRVPLDHAAREAVEEAIQRARGLRRLGERPPVTAHEGRCLRCSLAPVCLPEEERLAKDESWEPVRLFPPDVEGTTLHVMGYRSRVGKSGETLRIEGEEGPPRTVPVNDVHALVLHGNVQMTTQAIQHCASHGVAVHWFSAGGQYVAGLSVGAGAVQRRLRQYGALSDPGVCLTLARKTAVAKVEGQLRYLLRATRQQEEKRARILENVEVLRQSLRGMGRAEGVEVLRGLEGQAARAYFELFPVLLASSSPLFYPEGRNRRPPKDRCNALLSFGYALLYRSVMEAVLSVGLEPALGFYHTPRSSAHPLVLDLMDLFRVSVWDIPLLGSLNRGQWDPTGDFSVTKEKVWLSDSGRRKAVDVFERRLQEKWKHPVVGYSLSYRRTIELEVRLLEKEWTGSPGLYARARLR